MINNLEQKNQDLSTEFSEYSLNPIIELDLINKTLHFNVAARAQFPILIEMGINSPFISDLLEQFIDTMGKQNEIIVFARDIHFYGHTYEQQVFSIPKRNIILIYMIDITTNKQIEEKIDKINKKFEHKIAEGTEQQEATIKKLQSTNEIISKSNKQLHLALQSASVGIWSWDIHRDVFIFDEVMYQLFNIPSQNILNSLQMVMQFIYPDDRDLVIKALKSAWENKKECNVKFRVVYPDQSKHYLIFKGNVSANSLGQFTHINGICLEISKYIK